MEASLNRSLHHLTWILKLKRWHRRQGVSRWANKSNFAEVGFLTLKTVFYKNSNKAQESEQDSSH